MPAVMISNLSENTHKVLRIRAALNGRSTEAEISSILDAAIDPAQTKPKNIRRFNLGETADLQDAED